MFPSAPRRSALSLPALLLSWLLFPALCCAAATSAGGSSAGSTSAPPALATHSFNIGEQHFLLDGKPFVIRCGEIHFTRVPREYWRHRLQLCRAMGLNAVCVYLFWNRHEWQEGHYDWTAEADAAEFCRLAQEEGLWVLLRPGPYSCAEWEMGGLPWWLLKHPDIQLRSSDPAFLTPAKRYLREVGRVLAPLQITRGGPLLMVQVENEYGSFGKDAAYMGELRQALIDAGFDVPLFACNPPGAIQNGLRKDLFQVVNFGSGAEQAFATLRTFQPCGPLMNGEFYPGWFDTWGRAHRTGTPEQTVEQLSYMLTHGMSFSIYMAHGGTSFGFWSGADRPFQPDTSSYDYDAPISEAGWVTEKFERIRELFARHLQPGETLPPPPAPLPVAAVPAFTLDEVAPVLEKLPPGLKQERPLTIEAFDHSRGCTVYRSTLPAGPAATLSVKAVHDFAWVFLDGRQVGVLDRRVRRFAVELPARNQSARLELLVESVGRVNFGAEVADRKGLHAPVTLTPLPAPDAKATPDATAGQPAAPTSTELLGWDVVPLPLDLAQLESLPWRPAAEQPAPGPAFWRGHFEVEQPADTFLNLRSRGKGVVWVNGHCLGRFWNIGPTQTMYCPGVWLRAGRNEVVLLDLVTTTPPVLEGLATPVLNELRPELDFSRRRAVSGRFDASTLEPALVGSFAPGEGWQEARLASPARGRYLCLEALNAQDGKAVASIAELEVLGPGDQPVDKSRLRVLWVDSENGLGAGGEAENVLDGQPNSFWKTEDWGQHAPYPHRIVLDLGATTEVAVLRYLPRAASFPGSGRLKDYRLYLADTPFGLGK